MQCSVVPVTLFLSPLHPQDCATWNKKLFLVFVVYLALQLVSGTCDIEWELAVLELVNSELIRIITYGSS